MNYIQLKIKDTESAIKNKLKKLLTKLRWFKHTTTLVLVLKKIESEDKTKYDAFQLHSKQKSLLMKVTLMIIYLNQSIIQAYQTYKKF